VVLGLLQLSFALTTLRKEHATNGRGNAAGNPAGPAAIPPTFSYKTRLTAEAGGRSLGASCLRPPGKPPGRAPGLGGKCGHWAGVHSIALLSSPGSKTPPCNCICADIRAGPRIPLLTSFFLSSLLLFPRLLLFDFVNIEINSCGHSPSTFLSVSTITRPLFRVWSLYFCFALPSGLTACGQSLSFSFSPYFKRGLPLFHRRQWTCSRGLPPRVMADCYTLKNFTDTTTAYLPLPSPLFVPPLFFRACQAALWRSFFFENPIFLLFPSTILLAGDFWPPAMGSASCPLLWPHCLSFGACGISYRLFYFFFPPPL